VNPQEQEARERWLGESDRLWALFKAAKRTLETALDLGPTVSERRLTALTFERDAARQRWFNCLNAEYSRRLFTGRRAAA
jgi:hypothetical protein